MEVNATNNYGSGAVTHKDNLGKQDFLNLLVAQLKHQDPLNPADSAEFLAQLAQFSNLEQLIVANAKLDTLALAQASMSSTAVSSLIGKTVTVKGDSVQLEEGGASINFDLPVNSRSTTITIRDENGNVVRTIEAGAFSSGTNSVFWDGRDKDGRPCAPGKYTFSVQGTDEQGKVFSGTGRIRGVVTGVTYENGYPQLLIGDIKVALGEVIEISQ
jgi:flagellar basal-body rod modification protein FlgD